MRAAVRCLLRTHHRECYELDHNSSGFNWLHAGWTRYGHLGSWMQPNVLYILEDMFQGTSYP
jgi:hypothetical protein